jgi:hypothetical protein
MESAQDCGGSTPASFANYDLATSSWRTSQLCLDGEWSVFSETWPRAGMTRSGKAFELAMLVPHTDESESGLLPTPQAFDANTIDRSEEALERAKTKGGCANLREIVKTWPTPTVADTFTDKLKSSQQSEGSMHSVNLSQAVQMWATPIRRDSRTYKGAMRAPNATGAEPLVIQVGGTLNPTWVEWLMGYPLGWTALEDLATPSSRKSRSGSAEGL